MTRGDSGTASASRVDDSDPSIIYSPGWTQGSDASWSGGTAVASTSAGAHAAVSFTGSSVTWIGFRGPQTGIARVFLDGVFLTEVDMFSTTEEFQAAVFTLSGLPAGSHTLMIEVTGGRNAASTNHAIVVDGFDIIP
jgi:hypothetical protein